MFGILDFILGFEIIHLACIIDLFSDKPIIDSIFKIQLVVINLNQN